MGGKGGEKGGEKRIQIGGGGELDPEGGRKRGVR